MKKILLSTFLILLLAGCNRDKPGEFHGQECESGDCSGHEAGYQWAEEHDMTNPDDCGGDSDSFKEGCESYAGEHYEDPMPGR